MAAYLEGTNELLAKFLIPKLAQVPRVDNVIVDSIAKLATTPQEVLDNKAPMEHLTEPSISH